MNELRIEKDIPLPEHISAKRRNVRQELLERMDVGDSVYFEDRFINGQFVDNTYRNTATHLGMKIAFRKDSRGGVRMWRVK